MSPDDFHALQLVFAQVVLRQAAEKRIPAGVYFTIRPSAWGKRIDFATIEAHAVVGERVQSYNHAVDMDRARRFWGGGFEGALAREIEMIGEKMKRQLETKALPEGVSDGGS